MKQWKKLLAALLACAVLAGCSAGQKQEAASPEIGELAHTGQETGDGRNQITGKITEITGNEVTLALGTFSRNGKTQANSASGGTDQTARAEEADAASAEKTQAAEVRGGAVSLKNASVSGRQNGGAPQGEEGTPEGAAPQEENVSSGTFEANGQTQTIYIPVGLTISGASSGQRSSGFSSLKKGMVLRLTMGTDGSGDSVVAAVTVLKK